MTRVTVNSKYTNKGDQNNNNYPSLFNKTILIHISN